MYGSIIGDMVGSPYEFAGIKTTDFDFINEKSLFTDDSVMTAAVAEALMNVGHDADLDVIRKIVEEKYYILDKSCDEIRQDYKFDVSCQGTMPAAIQCFFEGNNYEEVVRLAVSLGGDADTLACISGSIAEAYYGVPEHLKKRCRRNLKEQNATSLLNIIERYEYYMKALENEEVIVIPKKPDKKRVHNMTIQDNDFFQRLLRELEHMKYECVIAKEKKFSLAIT